MMLDKECPTALCHYYFKPPLIPLVRGKIDTQMEKIIMPILNTAC